MPPPKEENKENATDPVLLRQKLNSMNSNAKEQIKSHTSLNKIQVATPLIRVAAATAAPVTQQGESNIGGRKKANSNVEQAHVKRSMDAAQANAKKIQSDVGTEFVQQLDEQLAAVKLDEYQNNIHRGFMRQALDMAELALKTDETPVGCVFVHKGEVIARGMNATNRTLNGTRHAEFMAISSIMNPAPGSDAKKFPIKILEETDVYVTVEPCIMCASLLRQYRIRKVYFGASNDKFGGTGGVLHIHDDPAIGAEEGYVAEGGHLREEAILALRKFYVQENEKAPEPRNKKERKLKTEVQPYQKPSTPALSKTRNSRFSKPASPASSNPETPLG